MVGGGQENGCKGGTPVPKARGIGEKCSLPSRMGRKEAQREVRGAVATAAGQQLRWARPCAKPLESFDLPWLEVKARPLGMLGKQSS
jgi:hypothetical protein